jgi:hypothetical protein
MTKKALLGVLFVALLAIAPVAKGGDGSPIPPMPPQGRAAGLRPTPETAIQIRLAVFVP